MKTIIRQETTKNIVKPKKKNPHKEFLANAWYWYLKFLDLKLWVEDLKESLVPIKELPARPLTAAGWTAPMVAKEVMLFTSNFLNLLSLLYKVTNVALLLLVLIRYWISWCHVASYIYLRNIWEFIYEVTRGFEIDKLIQF